MLARKENPGTCASRNSHHELFKNGGKKSRVLRVSCLAGAACSSHDGRKAAEGEGKAEERTATTSIGGKGEKESKKDGALGVKEEVDEVSTDCSQSSSHQ